MSLILDALRKSEGERQRGRIPTIHSSHNPVAQRPRARPWLMLMLISSAPAYLGAHIWSGGSVDFLDAPWLAAGKAGVERTTAATQETPGSTERARTNPERHTHAATAGEADGRPRSDVGPRARQPGAHREGSPASATPSPTAGRISLPPAAASGRAAASPDRADRLPMLWELPGSISRSVPELQVTVHVYSENASDRFVRLNGSKYREQDHVALDLVLEAITEEGVIMNYKGTRFRLEI